MLFFHDTFRTLIDLKVSITEADKRKRISSICQFISQMAAMVRAGPAPSWEPGTSSRSIIWVAKVQGLKPSSAASLAIGRDVDGK